MNSLVNALNGLLGGLPKEIIYILATFLVAFIIINFIAVFAGFCTYVERKVAGHMQARVGPYQVGPHGILQWLADAVKLVVKEDIVPQKADKLLFKVAPYFVFAGSFAAWAVLPLAPDFSPTNLNIGILFLLSVSSSVVHGILMAGWASSNKWSLFGAMRSAAQIVSYEIPTGLTILGMLLITGTLDMQEIVKGQIAGLPFQPDIPDAPRAGILSWYIFKYFPFTFIAFLVLFICALAETNRVPFDIPEAESEIVAGYHTEYSGFRFSIFFLSEYANMFLLSAVVVTFFLGGWLPPFGTSISHLFMAIGITSTKFIWFSEFIGFPELIFLEGLFWFFIKSFFLVFVMMWIRWTIPRYRVDQLMDLCWKKLTPLAFINLFIIGILIWACRKF